MSLRLARLATVVLLVITCILWSQDRHSIVPGKSLLASSQLSVPECAPLSYPVDQQCAHVREACPETDTFLSLPHLQAYFCTAPPVRPVVVIGLLAWLALLFATLGIGASDFFCPNLATIASILGLDENVAGVTLLAVGNGSPDVFSTFSAMKSQSGSLAVGELLGAATFIVSVVVGSMCIIKPFHVNRGPFLRDVGFFTVAVALLLWILHDGTINAFEAAILVGLYMIYVFLVIVGTWWENRREEKRRRELIIRDEFGEDNPPQYFERYRDDVSTTTQTPSLVVPTTGHIRAFSSPSLPVLGFQVPQHQSHSSTNLAAPGSAATMRHLPSFSLLSALEFRDVVASLRCQTSARSLTAFEPTISPRVGQSYRSVSPRTLRVATSTLHSSRESEGNPWDATLGREMHLSLISNESPTGDVVPSPDSARPPIPIISVRPPASRTSSLDEGLHVPLSRWQHIRHVLGHTSHILFPQLHGLSKKSIPSIVVAILATPAVLVFTITLPVVITSQDEIQRPLLSRPDEALEGRLIDFEEDGVERVLVAEDEVKEELREAQFNKWLMALQCTLGLLFCSLMIFGKRRRALWYIIAAAIAGISTSALVLVFADTGNHPAARLARCFMGFVVAVVWIMTIADEVVSVLKTFGVIFGLSDAIIGLTIFAIGNSLADLVANTSVAMFAPIMAFSACFGGPMLNILLGIGVSGSVVIQESGQPYRLHFSTTLLVSSIGLLVLLVTTLVFVPWNGYLLSRKWGMFLIASYVAIMAINIVLEVKKL